VNMLPSGMKEKNVCSGAVGGRLCRCRLGDSKNGLRGLTIEIRLEDEGMHKERTLTENVSPHGARVLMEREWRPGQQVMVISSKEGVWARRQIVYCEVLAESRFAVGLELSVRVEPWARSH
jgi:hypothetical protein